MFSVDLQQIITAMYNFPPEVIGGMAFAFCSISILVMLRIFGEIGLVVYICIALLAANIQVLKAGQYMLFDEPIVLGTVVFASTFLAIDMLVEFYGVKAAQRAVALGFASCILIMGMMLIAIGVRPLEIAPGSPYLHFNQAHDAMVMLFTPIPAIFLASLLSYVCSQYLDILIYQRIRNLTKGKALWLRASLANTISAFIDNVIFSTLAWVVFAAQPVALDTLFWVYIIGTYTIRLLVGVMFVPIMYIAKQQFNPLSNYATIS
jgi:uncharacterized integral membrane protein (TIGR00697 family)